MKNILLVDDESSLIMSMADGLESQGDKYRVYTASNGKEAVETLETKPVDLVVTDLRMPEMDGFELLAYINDNRPSTPTIVMSAFATPRIEDKLRELGALQVLSKPLDFEKLSDAINQGLTHVFQGGSLAGISVGSFLQLMEAEQKTSLLEVLSEDKKKGFFYLDEGHLHDAVCGDKQGEDAAIEMLTWKGAQIRFRSLPEKKLKKNIHQGLMSLLMEATHLEDERAGAEAGPPGEDLGAPDGLDLHGAGPLDEGGGGLGDGLTMEEDLGEEDVVTGDLAADDVSMLVEDLAPEDDESTVLKVPGAQEDALFDADEAPIPEDALEPDSGGDEDSGEKPAGPSLFDDDSDDAGLAASDPSFEGDSGLFGVEDASGEDGGGLFGVEDASGEDGGGLFDIEDASEEDGDLFGPEEELAGDEGLFSVPDEEEGGLFAEAGESETEDDGEDLLFDVGAEENVEDAGDLFILEDDEGGDGDLFSPEAGDEPAPAALAAGEETPPVAPDKDEGAAPDLFDVEAAPPEDEAPGLFEVEELPGGDEDSGFFDAAEISDDGEDLGLFHVEGLPEPSEDETPAGDVPMPKEALEASAALEHTAPAPRAIPPDVHGRPEPESPEKPASGSGPKENADKLQAILKSMADEIEGVRVCAVCGMDGLGLAEHNPRNVDTQAFGGKFAVVMQLIDKSVQDLTIGRFQENLVQAENAWILTRFLSPEHYLVVAVGRESTLGNVRMVATKYAQDLNEIFQEA